MSIDGGVLKFTADFVVSHTSLSLADWPEMASLIQVNREDPSAPGRRLRIALWRATEAVIAGKFQIDFTVSHAVDHLETLAQKVFEIPLPKNWGEPPIHHTASNCWHCGKFTANAELTQRDRAEGWGVKQAGDEVKDVYCPECGQALRAQVQAAIQPRSIGTSRPAPKQAALKKAVPEKPAPKRAAPKNAALKKAMPEKVAAKTSASEKPAATKIPSSSPSSHGKSAKK